jgi:hypothetical protein
MLSFRLNSGSGSTSAFRVANAMMEMDNIDIAALERVAKG